MALHTQLPIYKVAYGLFDVIMDLAKNMPRDFKASIGGKLRAAIGTGFGDGQRRAKGPAACGRSRLSDGLAGKT